MARTALLVVLLIVWAPMVAPAAAGESEVRKTWDGATVEVIVDGVRIRGAMAGQRVQAGLAKIPPGLALPTIIYVHGCTGLTSREESLFRKLALWGFVVVAPDSFARTGRVATCGSRAAQPATISLRREEVRYAARQAVAAPWADPDNLFLFGQSEGGWTVTNYGGDEFKARIASGAQCRLVRGPTPLLVVNFANDPWLTRGDDCNAAADEYLKIPGREHWPWGRADAKQLLFDYLAEHSGATMDPVSFEPEVVTRSDGGISLRLSVSVQGVYDAAEAHCQTTSKHAYLMSNEESDGIYTFLCN